MNADDRIRAELERRLAIIEDPGYEDPAHAPLPGRDIAWLLSMSVVVSVLAFVVWH